MFSSYTSGVKLEGAAGDSLKTYYSKAFFSPSGIRLGTAAEILSERWPASAGGGQGASVVAATVAAALRSACDVPSGGFSV